jgi:hypothetical protein
VERQNEIRVPSRWRHVEARQGIAGIEYPVRPLVAVTADQFPTIHAGGWSAEPKLDGFLN